MKHYINLLYGFLTISFLLCVLPISNAAPALAADLTINKSAPAPMSTPTAVYNWGGFYAGVNAGFGISNSSAQGAPQGSFLTDPNAAEFQTLFGSTMRDNQAGLLGGGTIGYNFQINSFVLGLEADLDVENNSRSQTFNQTASSPLSGVSTRNGALSNGWVGTVRPRVGYAFDRTLLYFTGGLAYGESKSWLSYTDNQFYSWAGGWIEPMLAGRSAAASNTR